MVKVLAGYHTPDRGGSIRLSGEPLRLPAKPKDLRAAGVSIVHQDFGLVSNKTVSENIAVGTFGRRRFLRRIDWHAEARAAADVLARLEADIDPQALVGSLTPAERSIVAIARALRGQRPAHGVVVLDESTRALPRNALEDFYAILRRVTREGGAALLVSHNLEEVLAVTDRVTVLRDGKVAADLRTSETSGQELARYMLGHDTYRSDQVRQRHETRDAVRITGVTGAAVEDFTAELRRGEIVGLTGLAGSGYEELPYLLSGARRARAGEVLIGPGRLELRRGQVRRALRLGIVLIPEHRADHGVALAMSVRHNLTLPRLTRRGRPWYSGAAWQRGEADDMVERLDIRPRDPARPVGQLSGGNQQKVLLGKWLLEAPVLLVLHEPTQGVDVGAREEILRAVQAAADSGAAVLYASIQPSDLAAACDRVLVIRDGRIHHEVTDVTEDGIVKAVYAGQASGSTAEVTG